MNTQHLFGTASKAFGSGFGQDPVFEPNPDYNFEDDQSGITMPNMYNNNQVAFAMYGGNMPNRYSSGVPASSEPKAKYASLLDSFDPQTFQQMQSAMTMPPCTQGVTAMQPCTQGEIVSGRADSVTQQYGQITPPNPDTPRTVPRKTQQPEQDQESDATKRKERARNAANKRHAKSKQKAKIEGDEMTSLQDDDVSENRGERQAHYREKNRVAAAKCRAKKKNHNDHLEDIHREEASKNKILKHELMSLRNELAQLKCLMLEHSPEDCQCQGIHEYSMRQAGLIARGGMPQWGLSMSSPSQDGSQSVDTPVSGSLDSRRFSMQEQPLSATRLQAPQSFPPGSWMQAT